MPRLTLSAKLYLILGAALCAGVVVSGVLWVELRHVARAYKAVITTQVRARSEARKVEVAEKMQVQEWSNLLLRGTDTTDRAAYTKAFRQREGEVRNHLATVQELETDNLHDSVSTAEAARFSAAFDGMSARYDGGLRAFAAGGGRNAAQVDRMVRDQDKIPTELLGTLLVRLDSLATVRMGVVDQEAADAVAISASATVATFAGLGVGLMVLVRWLLGSLGGLRDAARRIAAGDLTETLTYESDDELGALADAFRHMTENLRTLLREAATVAADVHATAVDLRAEADQMVSASDQVAGAAQQIAASTVSTTQNMTAAGAAAGRVAESAVGLKAQADKAETAAVTVTESATESAAASVAAREAMSAISDVTRDAVPLVTALAGKAAEIGAVTQTIEGIARQTNLLALNAAIEAARAGEQGRGFAVVAGHVKQLAAESANALETVRRLARELEQSAARTAVSISAVGDKVVVGQTVIDAAQAALARITVDIDANRHAVDRITGAATAQQAEAEALALQVESVSAAAEENAAVAEQVSALAEEQTASMSNVAASSERLAAIAGRLIDYMRRFTFDEAAPAGPLR
jgi:methyl-accepting chemotaxis protein